MSFFDLLKLQDIYSEGTKYVHDELNPKFWNNNQFDPEVRESLLNIAKDFYDHLNIVAPVKDIQLTGSLANYNYTDLSDLDVHIIIDFTDINQDVELVKKALDGVRFVWNSRHNIVINDHDVELYVQDINEQHTSSGLFSLLNNEWIREPIVHTPEIDEKDVEQKYIGYKNEIDKMEEYLNGKEKDEETYKRLAERAKKIKDKIQKDRKDCLSKSGNEFCVENLVFKKLRNNGDIERLIAVADQAYDMIYSGDYTTKDSAEEENQQEAAQ